MAQAAMDREHSPFENIRFGSRSVVRSMVFAAQRHN